MSMLLVLSPAKALDFETPVKSRLSTKPQFISKSQVLIDLLRPMSPADLASLMSISDKLAVLNALRFEQWSPMLPKALSRQAIFAFDGDVYEGLNAATLNEEGLEFAQSHVRILSGLYGVLRPLDLIQAYRLEMGTRLANPAGRDLYAYWRPHVASALNDELESEKPVLLNLASDEYFKAVDLNVLNARVVQPVFQDFKNGQYKVISFFAKKARGLMARYVVDHRVTDVEQLKQFNEGGYQLDNSASTDNVWVFRRGEQG